ncbi:hypothetical protein EBI_23642 [Enterocytozoon bieneusi H348]|nr:hypothetical protein EBI_23642 [Enterocytozoon bieneusi H348]|eukprot:XP_002650598.1 hypothetical protein EBI_23642 [Enterocytozoon bieneusi H348]
MQKKSLEWMSHDVEDLESYIKTGHEEISRVIELVLNMKTLQMPTTESMFQTHIGGNNDVFENVRNYQYIF